MAPVKLRIDETLVVRGLADDLKHAAALVLEGVVVVDDQRVDKPSFIVSQDSNVRLKTDKRKSSQFVSRGGDKLLEAIAAFNLKKEFSGSFVLDLGSSTGGFTDCVLQHGARAVYCVDVGRNQLDFSLRSRKDVTVRESVDVRTLERSEIPFAGIDWICVDMSFISVQSYAQNLVNLMDPQTRVLLLVKPQFETPKSEIPVGGIVTDPTAIEQSVKRTKEILLSVQPKLKILEHRLQISGTKGNKEVFFLISF